ncbi:hypothetical protein J0910_07465 [Nocardiopsis sp. CNT-189]|uniref:hypothetical protein n=1 Tax=Nocardiopsis oceanisediminis TaxID=2816862 RepID=UPI003B3205E6
MLSALFGAAVMLVVVILVMVNFGSGDEGEETAAPAQDSAGDTAPSEEESDSETAPSGSAETTTEESEAPEEAVVLFGPEELVIDLSDDGQNIDLDSDPPLVTSSSIGGADLSLEPGSRAPSMSTEGYKPYLAPLPEGGEQPGPEECLDNVSTNGTYDGDFERGARFCLQTGEGLPAYFEVTAAPKGSGENTIELTIWESP